LTITQDIRFGEIVQKPLALSNQFQQTVPRVVVFEVAFQMTGQVIDALG
jgi:hypothetical protein